MNKAISWTRTELFSVEPKRVAIYIIIYFAWGCLMNWFGGWAEIAEFTHWWQIITCYILYMVPISIILRRQVWHRQYAYGLIAMALLEFSGYAFESSYAYPGNILDVYFNERNFSLAMTLFFAFYFPIGNAVVEWVYSLFANKSREVTP